MTEPFPDDDPMLPAPRIRRRELGERSNRAVVFIVVFIAAFVALLPVNLVLVAVLRRLLGQ